MSLTNTPFDILIKKFHVTKPTRTGYNKIYEIRCSRCYFFELADQRTSTNPLNFIIHTNDYHINTTPVRHYSASKKLNAKFAISKMLMHFFLAQRVIPSKIRQKFFNFIRDKLLDRINIIKSRASSDIKRNQTTKTFFPFSYKKYRFYFGIYIPCSHLCVSSQFIKTTSRCDVPSPFVMSQGR